jgi:hypothetical protein
MLVNVIPPNYSDADRARRKRAIERIEEIKNEFLALIQPYLSELSVIESRYTPSVVLVDDGDDN